MYDLRKGAPHLVNGLLRQLAPEKKKILVGHSMGAVAAVAAAAADPASLAGLILVSPALRSSKLKRETGPASGLMQRKAKFVLGSLVATFRVYTRAVTAFVADLIELMMRPIFSFLLRRNAHARQFWEKNLKYAWHDESKLTNTTIFKYRRPTLVRRWDSGLLSFVRATTSPRRFPSALWSGVQHLSGVFKGQNPKWESDETFAQLVALSEKEKIPILIVHGENDKLIPVNNSVDLVGSLPTARMVQFEQCGHIPHEESPERFLDAIERFKDELR